MPEIITGRAHSERGILLFEQIKQAAVQENVLVIIPDQFSFENDSMLYSYLGARLFNKIETAGISALSEKICREYGGSTLSQADDNSKLIAMYRAQASLINDKTQKINFYKKSLLKPLFVSDCISLVDQLIRAGALPETLRIAAEKSPVGSARLSDIAIIYAAYSEELEKMGLRCTLSQTAQAALLAKDYGYFKGKKVFFNAFASFSADELALVKSVVGGADFATFSLLIDDADNSANPFAECVRTAGKIERISEDCGKTVKYRHANGDFQSLPLSHINREYFSYSPKKIPSEGLVKVCAASDIYEESEFVCAQIQQLVREEGLRFGEIAVICGALGETSRVLSNTAERYEIPYFVDMTESALNSLPAKYLMNLLDAALTRKYSIETILRIAKSPLSTIFDYDACDLEDFCIKWSVEGDMWKQPFKLEGGAAQNERVDLTRRSIIEPLEKFRTSCDNAKVGEMCEALFTLLDELEMSKQIYSAVRAASLENETELEVSRSFKQVWLGIVGAVKSIYENMKEEKISLRSFCELIKLMLSGIKISSPPQKSDCLRIGDAERSRISGVRVLFIMQANDGIFPQGVSLSGLLTETDFKALDSVGTELESSAGIQLDSERLCVYSAITAPAERLYVSYSESDRTGAICAPSQLPTALRSLFEDDITLKISSLPQEFFCTSLRTAFYNYLEHSKDKTQSAADIFASLKTSDEYSARLNYVAQAAEARDDFVSKEVAKQLFFPADLNLSATRISDYYKCPFSYFCKHGLKLYEPSAVEINPQFVGSITHSCLEKVMSVEENGRRVYNPEFTKMTNEQLYEITDRCTDEYIKSKMGGDYGKTLSFKFAIERLKKSVVYMAMNFREELKKSLFIPVAFEYNLTDNDGNPIISLQLDDVKINLRGSIDRADIYQNEDGAWLRIIDYKTGKQTFNEAEVYHGLDLQMLIYLLAVTVGNSDDFTNGEKLKPAGIMYSHIRFVPPAFTPDDIRNFEENGELESRLMLERSKNFKPDGVMLGEEIFDGLNKENEGVYTVFRFTSSMKIHGSSKVKPISEERLYAMELFALEKVTEMAVRLKDGDIKADPIQTLSNLNCVYCDYKGLCRNANPKNPRCVTSADKQLLDEKLKEIEEKNSQTN